jgi:hypothetical protein
LDLDRFDCPDDFDVAQAVRIIRRSHRILLMMTLSIAFLVGGAFSLIFRDFLSFPARFVLFLSPASGLGLIFYRFSFRKWDDKVSRLIIKAKTWGKVFSSHYSGKSVLFASLPGNFLPLFGAFCGILFAFLALSERKNSRGAPWVGEELVLLALFFSGTQLIGILNMGLYYMNQTPWF